MLNVIELYFGRNGACQETAKERFRASTQQHATKVATVG